MYRSASTNRVSDDHRHHHLYGGSSSASSKVSTVLRALSLEVNYQELPLYNNNNNYETRESEAAKRERCRDKFSENAVHLIPLVLISCALILWFLCNPDIDVPATIAITKTATKIKEMKIEGDVDSDATGTGNMPLELGDLSKPDQDRTTFFPARTKLP